MVIITKDTDIKIRDKKYITIRSEIMYTDEDYKRIQRQIALRAKRARLEKYNKLCSRRNLIFREIQVHQRLMLEADDEREFRRLNEVTGYMLFELKEIDAELRELAAKL